MRLTISLIFVCLLATQSFGQTGGQVPVAVRWWGQSMVSIETGWNLTVVIDPFGDGSDYEVPEISADLVLVSHEGANHSNVDTVGGEPIVVRGINEHGSEASIYNFLLRNPNKREAQWQWAGKRDHDKLFRDHAVFVDSVASWQDNADGSERSANAMFKIVVDGVSILHCGGLGQSKLTEDQVKQLGKIDVLLVSVKNAKEPVGQVATRIAQQVKPRFIIPVGHNYHETKKMPLDIDAMWSLKEQDHNTLAVSAGEPAGIGSTVVFLHPKPWQPTSDLATLLDKMDTACRKSQETFAKLSAEQMNWSPPNGTHTPRWNAEHMMGRQLGFFSQIYAQLDPETFTHINLNPAQMPPKFKPAHADWEGAEEARQMQRANAYVRRFAYLLDGVDLDKKAPGSFWTPRRLLRQMDRHFGEHTANVEKKFDLEGWPEG